MLPQKPDSTPEQSKTELQRLLQEALKKQRPRRLRLALSIILATFALFALLTWLLYPKGEPPLMTVVAFDDLGVAGTEVTLQGRLDALTEAPASLAGKDMVFVDDQGLLVPGQEAKEVPARTGPHGETSCQWTFPPDTSLGKFILRQLGDKFRPGMEDRGVVFFFPAATRLCLVQVEDTLTLANHEAWRKANIQDIVPAPGAAEALQEAHNNGYAIVYLALAANRPTLYQKVRGWVKHRSADGSPPFLAGVVLSRFTLPGAVEDSRPWQKTAERLANRFVLPQAEDGHRAIAGTIDVAQQFHAAGLRTLYVGAGEDLPAAVQRLPNWEAVRRVLEKKE